MSIVSHVDHGLTKETSGNRFSVVISPISTYCMLISQRITFTPQCHDFYARDSQHYKLMEQTCQPSRFWRDSPAFFTRCPAKSWKCPAFCTKSDLFCARAYFVTLPRCPDVNANHPIERNYGNYVRFLAKIPNATAAESPCYSVFWNAIDFCRLYTSNKISMCRFSQPSRFLPASPAFLREMSL